MKKQTGILIIIGIIIILVFTINYKPETFNIFYEDTQSECETQRQYLLDNGRVCVMDCFQMTSSVESCIEQYGYTGFNNNVGDWLVITSSSNYNDKTCREYYEEDLLAGEPKEAGMYNCIDIFKQEIGEINIGGTCTTFTDLITKANLWKSGSATFQELINYATQWSQC